MAPNSMSSMLLSGSVLLPSFVFVFVLILTSAVVAVVAVTVGGGGRPASSASALRISSYVRRMCLKGKKG